MKTTIEPNTLDNKSETLNSKRAELSEDEMKQVSGGDIGGWFDERMDDFSQWVSSDLNHKSGEIPYFIPGQEVFFFYQHAWQDGIIVSVDGKDGGIFDTEYVYTIQITCSETRISGIYESNIRDFYCI